VTTSSRPTIISELKRSLILSRCRTDNSKQSTKSTEEVTNANLFSLLKTYMNEKLSGIENNLNDRAVHLANKAEPSFRFIGNQL
jgi:hypothetical protein